MGLSSLAFSTLTIVLSFLLVICAVFYQDHILSVYNEFTNKDITQPKSNLFTAEQLALYNGVEKNGLYLSILGVVFDVTKGNQHYGKGASYHYFVGKDGSKSFITGDFKDDSAESDHVSDLSCDELATLTNWKNTFKTKYSKKGKLIGRFYDKNGTPTAYMREVQNKIHGCRLEKEREDSLKQKYPPCNIEWTTDEGTRVWCTSNSGGITRNWVGVPRQLYIVGEEKLNCVCIEPNTVDPAALLKEYDNCLPTSATCIVKNS